MRRSNEPALTPSARTLAELHATGESFAQLALRMSRLHKAYFLDLYPPNEQRLAEFAAEAEESLREAGWHRSVGQHDFRPIPGELLPGVGSRAPGNGGQLVRSRLAYETARNNLPALASGIAHRLDIIERSDRSQISRCSEGVKTP